jgi:hypothetical protein
MYKHTQQTYLLLILLSPSHKHPLIPFLTLIQHPLELIRESQFIIRGQNTTNVLRSNLFIHSGNTANAAHASNRSHHDQAQNGKRAHGYELGELASQC